MHKRTLRICLLLAVCLLLLAMPAYAAAETGAEEVTEQFSIRLSSKTISLYTGDTQQLQYVVSPLTEAAPTNEPVVFESTDPSVATVDQTGLITAVAKGECKIKVSLSNAATAVCKIKVKTTVPVTGIKLRQTEYYVVYNASDNTAAYWNGKKYVEGLPKLKVTYAPEKTTQKELAYTSSDPASVTVGDDGTLAFLSMSGHTTRNITIKIVSKVNKELTCDVLITLADSSAALREPVYVNGAWMEKESAPKMLKVGGKIPVYVSYYQTVRGLKVFLEGTPSELSIRRFVQDINAAPSALVNNKYIRRIIITSQSINNIFPEFETRAIGVAEYGESYGNNVWLDGTYYDGTTVNHELMHMWDMCLMHDISQKSEFVSIYKQEYMKSESWCLDYLRGYPEEFMAYTCERYFNHDPRLPQQMPLTFAFFEKYFNPASVKEDAA